MDVAGVERSHVNTVALRVVGSAPGSEVKEMFTVGQEGGPPMCLTALLVGYLGDGHGGPAAGRDAVKRPGGLRREDNRIVTVPGASYSCRGFAENLNAAARAVYCL